jgi:hypothetical protein
MENRFAVTSPIEHEQKADRRQKNTQPTGARVLVRKDKAEL